MNPPSTADIQDLAARVADLETKVGAMGRYIPAPPQNPRPVVDPKSGRVVPSADDLSRHADRRETAPDAARETDPRE